MVINNGNVYTYIEIHQIVYILYSFCIPILPEESWKNIKENSIITLKSDFEVP